MGLMESMARSAKERYNIDYVLMSLDETKCKYG